MKDGFLKAAAFSPALRVADCTYNAQQILADVQAAAARGVKLAVFPEFCLTGYTCGDLFLQDTLLPGRGGGAGAPCWTATADAGHARCSWACRCGTGQALQLRRRAPPGRAAGRWCPRPTCPTTGSSTRSAGFSPGRRRRTAIHPVRPGGALWRRRCCSAARACPSLPVGVEICEDLWAPCPPSSAAGRWPGATVIAQPVGQRRDGGQGRLPPAPGVRPVRPAGVRLCLRRRRARASPPPTWSSPGTT